MTNLLDKNKVTASKPGAIKVFRDSNKAELYYINPNGKVTLLENNGTSNYYNVYETFVIREIENLTGENIETFGIKSASVTIHFMLLFYFVIINYFDYKTSGLWN